MGDIRNPFEGKGLRADFAATTYNLLMKGEWVTYNDIMDNTMGTSMRSESISKRDGYGELKKAVPCVIQAIKEKINDTAIETRGNNRNMQFRYNGSVKDPLAEMRSARVIKNAKDYYQFCQDSEGFLPICWIEYFFDETKDLISIKNKRQKGDQIISAELTRQKNIHLLPSFYEAIRERNVLKLKYKPYGEELIELTIHPHLLKEYNGRWHLFCHADGKMPEFGFDLALDRIQGEPHPGDAKYIEAPKGFYTALFKDRIGVSQPKDERGNIERAKNIVVRAHEEYIFNLMDTKPIHSSQQVSIPFGNHDGETFGEFTLSVIPNNEFYGRILQMGAGLEIMMPEEVRNNMTDRVRKLSMIYAV